MNKIIPFFFLMASTVVFAQTPGATKAADQSTSATPVGLWKTIDDTDKKERAVIDVYEKDGKLFGKIVKTFPRPEDKDTCDLCPGELKDAKIIGLEILKNVSHEGDSKTWSGGTILDPKNGKDYKDYIELQDDGEKKLAKLKVRGFIGFSLLGRTQYWYRYEVAVAETK